MLGSPANVALEEYKICFASMHHHESVLWQLVSTDLVITGVILKFWFDTNPFSASGDANPSFVMLAIPILMGSFTSVVLWKHKLFWKKDVARMAELEPSLGFQREALWMDEYERSWRNVVKAWHLAFGITGIGAVALWVLAFLSLGSKRTVAGIA